MKRKEQRHQKTIIAMTPDEWDAKVNAALEELPEGTEGHQTTIDRSRTEDGGFMAIIDYWQFTMEPETIRDEYHLAGIVYRCQDCPHLQRHRNPRIRWLECEQGMKSCTKETAEACEWYYEQIKKAEGGTER